MKKFLLPTILAATFGHFQVSASLISDSPEQTPLIYLLPDELLLRICEYLPYADRVSLARTSIRFNRIANDPMLWKSPISSLPDKCLLKICQYLSLNDLASVAKTSVRLHKIAEDPMLWLECGGIVCSPTQLVKLHAKLKMKSIECGLSLI